MTTYNLMIDTLYPAGHSRGERTEFIDGVPTHIAAEPTYFPEKIYNAVTGYTALNTDPDSMYGFSPMLHVSAPDYESWKLKMDEVLAGTAELALCFWRYDGGEDVAGNFPVEFLRLTKDDAIGIQRMVTMGNSIDASVMQGAEANKKYFYTAGIAANEGMTASDYKQFHADETQTLPIAIIHFTSLRY